MKISVKNSSYHSRGASIALMANGAISSTAYKLDKQIQSFNWQNLVTSWTADHDRISKLLFNSRAKYDPSRDKITR